MPNLTEFRPSLLFRLKFEIKPGTIRTVEEINLEQLRSYRGNNCAVARIGSTATQNAFLSILNNPEHYSRDAILREIFRNYSGDAYGDCQWRKATGGWTTPEVPTIYGKFRSACRQFTQLSLDAGFISHLEEFMELMDLAALNQFDYLGIRDRFKETLGNEIVWRGMMLTADELNAIKKHGIMSPFPRSVVKMARPMEEFEAKILSTYIRDLVERHFHHENLLTPFVSVTDHRDIAIAMGRERGCKGEGRQFYLFKIQTPKIDLISYSEHGVQRPSKLQESIERGLDISVSINGKTTEYPWDDRIERYLFWKIDPEEIVEVTQPDVYESIHNSRKTSGRL